MKEFNINSTVKVKLNEAGWKILEQDYTPQDADENGYVSFQMWDLMSRFGEFICLGCKPPFETVILIDEKDLAEVK